MCWGRGHPETDSRHLAPLPSGREGFMSVWYSPKLRTLWQVLGVSCEVDLGPGQMLMDRCSQQKTFIKIGTNWHLPNDVNKEAGVGWIYRDLLKAHACLSQLGGRPCGETQRSPCSGISGSWAPGQKTSMMDVQCSLCVCVCLWVCAEQLKPFKKVGTLGLFGPHHPPTEVFKYRIFTTSLVSMQYFLNRHFVKTITFLWPLQQNVCASRHAFGCTWFIVAAVSFGSNILVKMD